MYLIVIDVTMSSYSIPLGILVSYRCHYMSSYSIPLCILVSYRCHYEFLQYSFMYLSFL